MNEIQSRSIENFDTVLHMEIHICNPSTQEVNVEGLDVQHQHGLLKILSHIFPKEEHKKKNSTFSRINLLDCDIVLCMGKVYSHFSAEKL